MLNSYQSYKNKKDKIMEQNTDNYSANTGDTTDANKLFTPDGKMKNTDLAVDTAYAENEARSNGDSPELANLAGDEAMHREIINRAENSAEPDATPDEKKAAGINGLMDFYADKVELPEKNKGVSELELKRAIEESTNFDELRAVIEQGGPIQGSNELYSPADLLKRIDSVKNGLDTEFVITSTYGLRDKVTKLMESDPVLIEKLNLSRNISNAKTFEDLYSIIEQNGGIQSGDNLYTPSYLENEIKILRLTADPEAINSHSFASSVTRAGGLRNKVINLIKNR